MVNIKTYIFNHFYQQYLVLLTMVPRNRRDGRKHRTWTLQDYPVNFPGAFLSSFRFARAVLRETILNGPTVHTKTYRFPYLYKQYLVLLTIVPRNNSLTVRPFCRLYIKIFHQKNLKIHYFWPQF